MTENDSKNEYGGMFFSVCVKNKRVFEADNLLVKSGHVGQTHCDNGHESNSV